MTTAVKIARAQKSQARRDHELRMIVSAGGGSVAWSDFLCSLYDQVSIKKHFLSAKQMAVVEKMIAKRGN